MHVRGEVGRGVLMWHCVVWVCVREEEGEGEWCVCEWKVRVSGVWWTVTTLLSQSDDNALLSSHHMELPGGCSPADVACRVVLVVVMGCW